MLDTPEDLQDRTKALENPLHKIREEFANYMKCTGCGCCADSDGLEKHALKLSELLNMDLYDDGSGVDYGKYVSEEYKR